MIKRMMLRNYRCFENTEISFRDISIVVGNNNAGKSTLIEALRIIALVAKKFKHTNYIEAPRDFNLPAITRGLKVNTEQLKIDLRSVVHMYRENEGVFAEITALFDDNIKIRVYLNSETVFSVVEINGKQIKSKGEAGKAPDIPLDIMPQIGLIREDERKLEPNRVKENMSTRLSSRHFRNQLYLYQKECFEEFRQTAQTTWRGLRILDLSYEYGDDIIKLMVYDAGYASEIGTMGSGLQMWLQMVWFISRCAASSTIVLDEPDVYMHPDLQRKIFKIVQQKFKQVIIATHSVEIISAVQPHQIVTVDKVTRRMKYANSSKAVQNIVNSLGSEHNLSLIRLGAARKCIFVEGKDMKTLSRFHDILYESSSDSLDLLPAVALGGWSRFGEALGAARLFYEETQGEIEVYCLLDRDYHLQEEIDDLYIKANENHLKLHVWEKKEIENYIVTPQSVFRLTKLPEPMFNQFCDDFFEKLEELKVQTLGGFLDQIAANNRGQAQSTNLKAAIKELEEKWDTLEKRLNVVNGKDLISLVNQWVKERYRQNISRAKLLSALTADDIPEEVKRVIDALNK